MMSSEIEKKGQIPKIPVSNQSAQVSSCLQPAEKDPEKTEKRLTYKDKFRAKVKGKLNITTIDEIEKRQKNSTASKINLQGFGTEEGDDLSPEMRDVISNLAVSLPNENLVTTETSEIENYSSKETSIFKYGKRVLSILTTEIFSMLILLSCIPLDNEALPRTITGKAGSYQNSQASRASHSISNTQAGSGQTPSQVSSSNSSESWAKSILASLPPVNTSTLASLACLFLIYLAVLRASPKALKRFSWAGYLMVVAHCLSISYLTAHYRQSVSTLLMVTTLLTSNLALIIYFNNGTSQFSKRTAFVYALCGGGISTFIFSFCEIGDIIVSKQGLFGGLCLACLLALATIKRVGLFLKTKNGASAGQSNGSSLPPEAISPCFVTILVYSDCLKWILSPFVWLLLKLIPKSRFLFQKTKKQKVDEEITHQNKEVLQRDKKEFWSTNIEMDIKMENLDCHSKQSENEI